MAMDMRALEQFLDEEAEQRDTYDPRSRVAQTQQSSDASALADVDSNGHDTLDDPKCILEENTKSG